MWGSPCPAARVGLLLHCGSTTEGCFGRKSCLCSGAVPRCWRWSGSGTVCCCGSSVPAPSPGVFECEAPLLAVFVQVETMVTFNISSGRAYGFHRGLSGNLRCCRAGHRECASPVPLSPGLRVGEQGWGHSEIPLQAPSWGGWLWKPLWLSLGSLSWSSVELPACFHASHSMFGICADLAR